MLGSYRIGRAFGIDIRVHWLFAAMVLFFLMVGTSHGYHALEVLGLFTVLFGVVVLHELGHSLVAQRYGIRVLDITLWPLGGMARMSEIPENSRIEAAIAIAGPLVNFALAALAAPLFFGSGFLAVWSEGAASMDFVAQLLAGFIAINLMLGIFNMIPAFPMDGGRILRAWFGRRGDWLNATERAVRVGRVFAVLMVVGGIWNPLLSGPNLMLSLVGVFVWFAGSRELLSVRLRHARSPFASLEGTPLGELFRQMARGPGGSPGAEATRWTTTDPGGPPPPSAPPEPPPPRAPDSGPRRPTSDPSVNAGPWTEDRIRELERYRGRLRPGDRP